MMEGTKFGEDLRVARPAELRGTSRAMARAKQQGRSSEHWISTRLVELGTLDQAE